MIIIGEKEVQNKTLSLRKHQIGDIGSFAIKSVVKQLKIEIMDSQTTFKI